MKNILFVHEFYLKWARIIQIYHGWENMYHHWLNRAKFYGTTKPVFEVNYYPNTEQFQLVCYEVVHETN